MPIIPTQEFATARPQVSLDGAWEFSYDPANTGLRAGWFHPEHRLPESIHVPGCTQAQQFASAGAVDVLYDGLPELASQVGLRYPSRDVCWYARSFTVPPDWDGRDLWLHLGGVNPAADLWLNGVHLGRTRSSRCPVRVDVTSCIRRDGENRLVLRLDWPDDAFHGLYDIYTAWSGLYRSVWLEAVAPSHLADIHVLPAISPRKATVTLAIRHTGDPREATVECIADGDGRTYNTTIACRLSAPTTDICLDLPMPGAALWHPDDPRLYTLTVRLRAGETVLDEGCVRFGLREVRVDGYRVLLNGMPIFLRGGCDDQYYPRTVCPPAEKGEYLRRLWLARDYGFNYTKSCVEIFTREFLEAADEVGMLVCQELPFLLRDELVRYPAGLPGERVTFFHHEIANMLHTDRNHPAVILYSMTSELGDAWLANPHHFRLFSQELPALARRMNPSALVMDATGVSGGPDIGKQAVPVETAYGRRNTDLDGSWLAWAMDCRPLAGPIPGLEPVSVPFIFHEFAWITELTDPNIMKRYEKLPVLPLHVPEMIAAARANGQADILPTLVASSRRLKYALRKQAFELARKEPKAAGYHHWLLHDFPFAAEGVFNEFWEAPADLPAAAFRAYNDDTVLCLEHGDRWTLAWGVPWQLACVVSHFGAATLPAPVLTWELRDSTRALASGNIPLAPFPPGTLITAPPCALPILQGDQPSILTLTAVLRDGDRIVTCNHWRFWAFPLSTALPDGVCVDIPGLAELFPDNQSAGAELMVTNRLHEAALETLARGGRVLLIAAGAESPSPEDLPRAPGTPLYRTVPYNHGSEGIMGTLVRPHPALGNFPHEGWCDFVWAPLLDGAHPINLQQISLHIEPIIRAIGHMRTMRDMAYLFELAVGPGRLLACAMRLTEAIADGDPAARYLLGALVRYLAGPELPAAPAIARDALRAVCVK